MQKIQKRCKKCRKKWEYKSEFIVDYHLHWIAKPVLTKFWEISGCIKDYNKDKYPVIIYSGQNKSILKFNKTWKDIRKLYSERKWL